MKRIWSADEIKILEDNYSNCVEVGDLLDLFEGKTIKQIKSKAKLLKLKKNNKAPKKETVDKTKPIKCKSCQQSYTLEEDIFPTKVSKATNLLIVIRCCKTCKNKKSTIKEYNTKYGIELDFNLMLQTYSLEQWYRWTTLELTPKGVYLSSIPKPLINKENVAIIGRYVIKEVMKLSSKEEIISISQKDLIKFKISFSRSSFVLGSPLKLVSICFPEIKISNWEYEHSGNNFWNKYENFLEALLFFHNENLEILNSFGYDSVFNTQFLEESFSKLHRAKESYYREKTWENCLKDLGIDGDFKADNRISYDGNVMDSFEEKLLYDFLHQNLNIKVINIGRERSGKYFFYDKKNNKRYAPDFLLKRDNKKDVIIEYFGMYCNRNSEMFSNYREKTHQKIEYFNSKDDIVFISLFKSDFKNKYQGVKEKISQAL